MSKQGRIIRSISGLDKVGIRINREVCNTHFKGMYKLEGKLPGADCYGVPGVDGVNIINKGQYFYVMFHDRLFLDIHKRIIDVVQEGLIGLYNCSHPFIKYQPTIDFIAANCVFSECEFYYDFYNFKPVIQVSMDYYRIFNTTTLYSPDYRQKFNRDGSVKETFKSLIIYYDKAKHVNSPEMRYRLEFRFAKNYLKGFEFNDLYCTTQELYHNKIFKKIVRYTRKHLNADLILFDYQNMNLADSSFCEIFLEAFCNLKSKSRGVY